MRTEPTDARTGMPLTKRVKELEAELEQSRTRTGLTIDQLTKQVQELEAELEQARKDAETDAATGLYNFRRLERAVKEWYDEGTECALFFFDVANLKAVNDTHGHSAGNQVLKAVANVCRRASDLAVRYGGDEVVIATPDFEGGVSARIAFRDRIEEAANAALGDGVAFLVGAYEEGNSVLQREFPTRIEVLSRRMKQRKDMLKAQKGLE